ncbi:uncharacterized protein LOC113367660 [Ctenocephalides felis]|uniref:uncharacterized protein LOC113367660 n=1 Tax=Ctenocephalides felis TaxID=7515 RepID=UPI000E6E57ED|nr:uncharacterized protein LOC113367660 [Ctenocephalides felis]
MEKPQHLPECPSDFFDPMSEHYYSQANSFEPGPSGNIGDLHKYKTEEKIKLFIANIPRELTEKGLRNIFQSYGEVLEACIKTNTNSRFGFVVYEHLDCAAAAIHGLHLKKPFDMVVKFSEQNQTAKPVDDVSIPELPPKVPERNLPSIVSNHTSAFMKSKFYHQNDPNSYNKFITKLAKDLKPKNLGKRILEHQKKISELMDGEISQTFEFNGLEKYNECENCQNPGIYKKGDGLYFCSLHCYEKKSKEE